MATLYTSALIFQDALLRSIALGPSPQFDVVPWNVSHDLGGLEKKCLHQVTGNGFLGKR